MTENEAKDILRIIGFNRAEEGDVEDCEAIDVAMNALEDIQAYRAIGTIKEFKALKESKCQYWNAEHEDCVLNYAEIRNKAIDEVLETVKKTYHNFSGYDLEKMTKYGNESAEQQHESYSTLMMYEIAGEFDDLIDTLEQLKAP